MNYQLSYQRGATLLVGLIMLLLMTMISVATFRLSKTDLQIVSNSQQRAQILPAAQAAIEKVISTSNFVATPNNAIPNPCNDQPNRHCTDVNGDNVTDVNVQVAATCVSTQIIPTPMLDFEDANDAGCLIGSSQDFGIAGAANNNSICANMLWDIRAEATDPARESRYVINQGTAVRAQSTTVCP